MTTITLPARDLMEALRFALSAAGKSDTRRILNGVCVESLNGRTVITGTDGHRSATVHFKDSVSSVEDSQWTYDRDSVERAVKVFSKPGTDSVVTLSAGKLEIDGVPFPMRLLEGRYVDWRRVDRFGKERTPAAMIGMNVNYIIEAGRACKRIANGKYGGVKMYTGDVNDVLIFEPGIVEEDFPTIDRAYIQIMPMRL